MEGWGDAKLDTSAPNGVVVVERAVAESVHPNRPRATFGDRAPDGTSHHDGPEAELDHRMLELFQCLFGRERGDARHGDEPVGVRGVLLSQVGVERGRHGLTQLVVGEVDGDESVGGVQHGEVKTKFIKAFVEQAREHGGGPVERIAGGDSPPGRLDDSVALAHLVAHSLERLTAVHDGVEALRHRLVGQIDQQVPHEREELDQVSVAVDDGMVELGPDAPNPVRRLVVGHLPAPSLDAVILRLGGGR